MPPMNIGLHEGSKKYESTAALDRVSLDIGAGQLVAVLGLNGAGKTTLLKALAGFVHLNNGEVIWEGRPYRRDDLERRRRMMFVPDLPFLFPDLTVLENLAVYLEQYEVQRDGAFIADLLESFDLLERAAQTVKSLSRGQIYKTALAALFSVAPDSALLDEPFASGMDAGGIQSFKAGIRRLVRDGAGVVYTTQLVDLALAFADRIVVLHQGRIHADLTPESMRQLAASDPDPVISRLIGAAPENG